LRSAGEEILAKGRARAAEAGVAADSQLFEGLATRLADAVEQEAQRWGADLVVLGTHGRRGASRFFLGSDAEQVLRSSPVPVLLVRMPQGA
ncbi:universal stress protein, partial [Rhizobacter sp. OV335]|uniref:universal stress protein n=1 Tax=Rhizobacter sp. OV335 TaxID=1500264 RepID=UPI00092279BA